MSFKPIIIVSGEPYGIFNEIFLKVIKKYSFKRPLILIGSMENLLKEANIKNYKAESFKRYGSARKLYNFKIDNLSNY